MRAKLPLFAVLTATSLVGWPSPAYANARINGDFEASWPSGAVAPSWATGNGGTAWAWAKDTVDYRGTLVDGTEFDSSYKRGNPITFQVDKVVKGWTEALQMMKEDLSGPWIIRSSAD